MWMCSQTGGYQRLIHCTHRSGICCRARPASASHRWKLSEEALHPHRTLRLPASICHSRPDLCGSLAALHGKYWCNKRPLFGCALWHGGDVCYCFLMQSLSALCLPQSRCVLYVHLRVLKANSHCCQIDDKLWVATEWVLHFTFIVSARNHMLRLTRLPFMPAPILN